MRVIAAFGVSALTMLVLDFIWLSVMGNRLYRPVLGDWLNSSVKLAPAVIFYFLFLAGVTFLATLPALQQESWVRAAVNGGVFGLVAYATYTLTNHATLARWSTTLSIADLTWGTLLAATTATAGYLGARLLVR